MMNIGIVGSRRRNSSVDFQIVSDAFGTLFPQPNDKIISGGCSKGADRFAEIIAKVKGLSIIIHKPDWDNFGRMAGLRRNTDIAAESDVLIACVAHDRKGGTEDTIKKFKKFHPDGELIIV
jgi:hypothetical protein